MNPTPLRGGAYRHQKSTVRYLVHYNRLLLIHDPGVGKSCSITHSAELFKKEYIKNPDDPTKIRRAIILIRGPTLEENIRNEIVCKCTNKVYETPEVLRSETETAMKGNITRALKEWYDIMTYRDFANIINQFEREEDLEDFMSNVAIYVDEAHNVATIHDITNESVILETIEEVEDAEDTQSYYDTIFRAFHKGKRNVIVLATATPMNNLAIDIIPTINLILPLDKQMHRWRKDQNVEFSDQPLEYFEPYFRGRVSYIRALDTGAKALPIGDPLPGYSTIVYYCDMSLFQYGVYRSYDPDVGNRNMMPLRQERFYDRSRQISNFVFPNASFGTAGFDHYIELTPDGYRFKNTPDGLLCKSYVKNRPIYYPKLGEPFIDPFLGTPYDVIPRLGEIVINPITGEPIGRRMTQQLVGQPLVDVYGMSITDNGLPIIYPRLGEPFINPNSGTPYTINEPIIPRLGEIVINPVTKRLMRHQMTQELIGQPLVDVDGTPIIDNGLPIIYPRLGEPFINPSLNTPYIGNPIIPKLGELVINPITKQPMIYRMTQQLAGQPLIDVTNNVPITSNYGLATLSAKYAEIVRICNEKWPGEADVIQDDSKGIIFVYFPDYVKGSGAILLGLCLQENGYEEFKQVKNIFDPSTTRNFGPCTSGSSSQTVRSSHLQKRKRYAILTSKTPKSQVKPLFDTLNSYENRYGQYIQILIGSKTAREGININNGIAMIMASSGWNASTNWQAEERIFRSTSHVSRLAEKIARTGNQDAIINVETYNMAAVFRGDPDAEDPEFRVDNGNTIDPRLYAEAEVKDRTIRKVRRYLKQSAMDSYINYERNVRPTDVNGSAACDYMDCNYQPTGIVPEYLTTLDRTTKVLNYSEDEIENASTEIRKLFSHFHSLKIEQIHQRLHLIDPIFIDMAIEKMISENVKFNNRMGFFGYLRESQSGVIYLESDPFEIRAHPENTVYNSVLIGTQDPHNNTFNDYVSGLDSIMEGPILTLLANTDPNNPNFHTILENLSLISKVNFLEDALYRRKLTGETNEFDNAIISSFNNVIFEVPEPIDLLHKTSVWISTRGKGRGRKPNPNKQIKLDPIKLSEKYTLPSFDPNIVSDNVIIHTLLNQNIYEVTSYGSGSNSLKPGGHYRILKMSEGTGWRDVNLCENLVYNNLIQRSLDGYRFNYDQRFPIYGIILPPSNDFLIRDRESENAKAASRDARSINDGRRCNTWHKPNLVDILYRLGLFLPTTRYYPNITRQAMIDYLRSTSRKLENFPLETFPDDKIVHFYQWYQSNFSRDDICDHIRQWFENTGRIYTGKIPSQAVIPTAQIGTIQTGAPQMYPVYTGVLGTLQAGVPQGYTTPTAYPQGYTTPTVYPQGYTTPTGYPQGYTTPTAYPQGYTTPTAYPQGYTTPTAYPQGQNM
jgi:hypothetical protein